jgi:hypothetical protein
MCPFRITLIIGLLKLYFVIYPPTMVKEFYSNYTWLRIGQCDSLIKYNVLYFHQYKQTIFFTISFLYFAGTRVGPNLGLVLF